MASRAPFLLQWARCVTETLLYLCMRQTLFHPWHYFIYGCWCCMLTNNNQRYLSTDGDRMSAGGCSCEIKICTAWCICTSLDSEEGRVSYMWLVCRIFVQVDRRTHWSMMWRQREGMGTPGQSDWAGPPISLRLNHTQTTAFYIVYIMSRLAACSWHLYRPIQQNDSWPAAVLSISPRLTAHRRVAQ